MLHDLYMLQVLCGQKKTSRTQKQETWSKTTRFFHVWLPGTWRPQQWKRSPLPSSPPRPHWWGLWSLAELQISSETGAVTVFWFLWVGGLQNFDPKINKSRFWSKKNNLLFFPAHFSQKLTCFHQGSSMPSLLVPSICRETKRCTKPRPTQYSKAGKSCLRKSPICLNTTKSTGPRMTGQFQLTWKLLEVGPDLLGIFGTIFLVGSCCSFQFTPSLRRSTREFSGWSPSPQTRAGAWGVTSPLLNTKQHAQRQRASWDTLPGCVGRTLALVSRKSCHMGLWWSISDGTISSQWRKSQASEAKGCKIVDVPATDLSGSDQPSKALCFFSHVFLASHLGPESCSKMFKDDLWCITKHVDAPKRGRPSRLDKHIGCPNKG